MKMFNLGLFGCLDFFSYGEHQSNLSFSCLKSKPHSFIINNTMAAIIAAGTIPIMLIII